MSIFFPKQTFIYKILEEGRWRFHQFMFVYWNTIKDYMYLNSGGPRAPPPFKTQFTMYIILKGKRKMCFLADFTHLEL